MKTRKVLKVLTGGIVAGLLLGFLVSLNVYHRDGQAEAQAETVNLSMEVIDANCSTKEGAQIKCNIPTGSPFRVLVNLNSFKGFPDADNNGIAGYLGFDILLYYSDGLTFKSAAMRNVWPDCAFEAHAFFLGVIAIGCAVTATGTYPNVDFLESTYLGPIMRADFNCGTEPSAETITLVHGRSNTKILDEFIYSVFDPDGNEVLTINCVEPVTPTPTETPTVTSTPTPTITSTPTPTFVPGCDMNITKTDSADPVNTGAVFSYEVTVSNHGDLSCNEVTLGDILPANVHDVIAFGIPCTMRFPQITCYLHTMGVGDTASLHIIATAPTEPGTLTNRALVTTTTRDVNRNNNRAVETTVIQQQGEDRKVIFIQGIDSESGECSETFRNRVQWMVDYLIQANWVRRQVPSLNSPEDFFYFSYSDVYCLDVSNSRDFQKPDYFPTNTCNGVIDAANKLQSMVEELIERYPNIRFDIIAHSMGGLVAAEWLWAHPDMQVRINSVITFDSPLRGIPHRNPASACAESNSSWQDLLCDDYTKIPGECASLIFPFIAEIGEKIPFFTLDATQQDIFLIPIIEFVPRDRTTLLSSESKLHCQFDDDHSSVWERPETSGDTVRCWFNFTYPDDEVNPDPESPDFRIRRPSHNVKAIFVACAVIKPMDPEDCRSKLRRAGP